MSHQQSFFVPESEWRPRAEFPNLSDAKAIAIDTETRDPNLLTHGPGYFRNDGYLVGVSIAVDGFKAYYPIRHEGGDNLDETQVLRYIKDVCATRALKIGANLGYDLGWLWHSGVEVQGPFWDVQIAEPLLDEHRRSYSLDSLSWYYLKRYKNETLLKDAALAYGEPKNPKSILWALPARYVGPYAEEDAVLPLEIMQHQVRRIQEEGLNRVCELEMDLIPIIWEIRKRGVPVDLDAAQELKDNLLLERGRIMAAIKSETGLAIDPWSSDSLQKACNHLGVSYPTTARGNASFTASWLEHQSDNFLGKVLAYRQVDKLIGTFIDGLIFNHQVNGRIHPEMHQVRNDEHGTISGRFSYSNPNLQQVPKRNEQLAPKVRRLFVPEQGALWYKGDYSQQEPRVTVHFAEKLQLTGASSAGSAFRECPRTDYHQLVADMAGILRKEAKAVNLGLAYGMGFNKLTQEYGIDPSVWDSYHAALPYIRELQEAATRQAELHGYVRTIYGRRARFNQWEPVYNPERKPALGSKKQAIKAYGAPVKRAFCYKALNRIIQGSSADMIKESVRTLYRELGWLPYLLVHDENDGPIEDIKQKEQIDEVMRTCLPLSVPIAVDSGVGNNWAEADAG